MDGLLRAGERHLNDENIGRARQEYVLTPKGKRVAIERLSLFQSSPAVRFATEG